MRCGPSSVLMYGFKSAFPVLKSLCSWQILGNLASTSQKLWRSFLHFWARSRDSFNAFAFTVLAISLRCFAA